MPVTFRDKKKENGERFYCPNGHHLSWRETTVDRLEKRLATMEGSRDSALRCCNELQEEVRHQRARVAGYMGVAAKVRKAASA